MTASFIAICFAFLVSVSPLAFYLCWLATVHKRVSPTAVAGTWDALGLVGATSGLLLIGGLLFLSFIHNDPRLFLRAQWIDVRIAFATKQLVWVSGLVVYVLILAVGLMVLLNGRAKSLSIYNVDAEQASDVIDRTLQLLNVPATRRGDRWDAEKPVLKLIPFHGLNHATVELLGASRRERDEIARRLRQELRSVKSADLNVAGWFTALAGGAVITIITVVGFLCFLVFFR